MHRLSPSPGLAPDPTPTPSTCSIGLTRTVSQDITSSHVAASAAIVPAVSQAVSSPRPLETSQQDSTLQADSLGHRLEPLELEPELLSPGEAQSIQSRLGELGHGPGLLSSTTASPRESELAAMVLRLLAHYHYTSERDPSEQLAAQAETIASLTAQRDMLMQQYTTASESWQAERDGWERSAEALMAQNSAASAVTKEDIVERLAARLEDENGRWTHKLIMNL
ncbi:hypothetical protein PHLGIDRAFT_196653 [Phlebiopsis gigantea 11061_1 CR5-6]|uniref:Uncharacterized protein n=1 Tax=Phlebiopsis gigantea (strain 11061_1 CR5-6) TaxID=745531 RepID=A0A0C3PTC6_PHLG1|nr:hypothetical protein PHLGIDRAFT_196653 [Phlebiopsis gigantea 11061_1 CR5-6]